MLRINTTIFSCIAAAFACNLGATVARADPVYVALGDQLASGSGVLPDTSLQPSEPLDCARASWSYPVLLASAIKPIRFIDASCYIAPAAGMTHSYRTHVLQQQMAPQFDNVPANATLVTFTAGLNDVVSVPRLVQCVLYAVVQTAGCKDHMAGVFQAALDQVGPVVADDLAVLRRHVPLARVLVVGYPAMFASDGQGCFPFNPFSPEDLSFIDSLERQLNEMLADEAAAAGYTFVDTYGPSIGHDSCKPAGERWFEPVITLPLPVEHLNANAAGEQAIEREILASLGKPVRLGPRCR